jgi:DNA-binding SARP family transcriptional activator/ABC-type branched-subunit amino acid transport system substrate-binding protein/streptogramin lyase
LSQEFRLLGPVEPALGGPRQRSVLAILLLNANQVVPSERLMDLIWGEAAPPTAATGLQGYVSQLRKAIEPDRSRPTVIVTVGAGYVARVGPEQLDVARFEQLMARAREASSPQDAADVLAKALALWRGPPLADLRNESWAQEPIRRLEEQRIAALEDHVEARLGLDRHREVAPELEALVAEHPLRERLRGQLMLALYRSGRQAEALDVFAAGRRLLVDELGIEPGSELRALHQRMLEQDPTLMPARGAQGSDPSVSPRRGVLIALILVAIVVTATLVALGGDDSAPPGPPANSLVLLDPRTGELRDTFDVGGTPTSVAVGEGAAWVLNADDQTITRVDERTHDVKTFGSGGVPTDIGAGAGGVWIGNGKRTRAQYVGYVATSLVRLDPSTTAVRGTVTLPNPGGFTSNLQQDHIAITRDAVWVVNPDASVSRVDPQTNRVADLLRGFDAGAVAAGDEGVWALGLDSTLVRLDERGRPIQVAANTLSAVAVGAGAVWAAAPYDGIVWRIDPEPRLVQRTIDVGKGVTDVAYGLGSVWALNSLRGTLSRIDPRTNRVTATARLGNTPRQLAVGAGGVWASVAGAARAPIAAAERVTGGPALPADTCGEVFYGSGGVPDRLIVSDFPLRGGGALPTQQMSEAIAHVLRQRGFRAGRWRVGYQSCDDSTSQTEIFDPEKCVANARLYAQMKAVLGVIGPFNSDCAISQIPIANRARLAMITPTSSFVPLTRPYPLAPEGHLADLYPTGERTYFRVVPRDDATAAAAALFLRDQGRRRVAVVHDGGYGLGFALDFRRAARRLGLTIVASRRWNPKARSYRTLVTRAPAAIYVAGLIDSNGGRVIRDLRTRFPQAAIITNDGFLPIAKLFATAGRAARGVYVTRLGRAPQDLPPEGRHFVADFAATQGARPVYFESVYAAQAAETLLDAIARSDGTARSVVRALRGLRVDHGLVGEVAFDAGGDVTKPVASVFRARRGGASTLVSSTDGAYRVRIVEVPRELLR